MFQCDLVIERATELICPICLRPIGDEFTVVEHRGTKVWVCKTHPIDKKVNGKDKMRKGEQK